MKTVILDSLEDYLKASEAYTNPKVLKIVEIFIIGDKGGIRAITFPTTFMLEWKGHYKILDTDREEFDRILNLIKDNNHVQGKVSEVTTGRM